MPFPTDEFKSRLNELEQRHREWFLKHPPINKSPVNSVHDHYYIYAGAAGHQLRFNTSSDLSIEIRSEIKTLFEQLKDK